MKLFGIFRKPRPSDLILESIVLSREINLKRENEKAQQKAKRALNKHLVSNGENLVSACLTILAFYRGETKESESFRSVYERVKLPHGVCDDQIGDLVHNTSLPSELTEGIQKCALREIDINEELKSIWNDEKK